MPDVKKAELIEGIVYMPSPVRLQRHGKPHFNLITWLGIYQSYTPGTIGADNATARLDLDNELCFLVVPNADGNWQWHPLTFLNDYVGVYQVAAEYDNYGSIRVRDAKLMHELEKFAMQWDGNIKHQGFIEAFHRKYGCTLNGAANGATHAVP